MKVRSLIWLCLVMVSSQRGLLRSSGTGAPNPEFGALQAAGVLINCPLLITFGRQAP